jgi:alkanesulfonate monooxygenase SsuD/methylene tetrahydromethanopterin reductase-like flavin-dependent oxidoreductase (luciferase family)
VREKVLAMKQLWTEEEASFQGEHVSFSPSWSWPKPTQQPHPPVIMGGAGGPVTFRHVIEYCDGWMPIHGRREVLPKVTELRRQAEAAGRDPATIEIGVFGVPGKAEVLESYAQAGVARCVLGLPPEGPDAVLPLLDRYAELVGTL